MAPQQPVVSLEDIPDPDRCHHHWVIQPAMGPASPGVCQVCGEERDFMNYVESASWGDSRLGNRSSGGASEVAKTVAVRRGDGDEEQ